jgi:transposase-like protein
VVDRRPSHRGRDTPIRVKGAMVTPVLHGPYGRGTARIQHGRTPEGKPRYRCRECPDRGRTCLLEYAYVGHSPDITCQIVEMALHASGMRDTARVLHVSPTTVIQEFKTRPLTSNRYIRRCCGSGLPSRSRRRCVGLTNWHRIGG